MNLIPFENGQFVPRVGERVFLPGSSEGAQTYDVREVEYIYGRDDSGVDDRFDLYAKPLKVVVRVSPVRARRHERN